MPRRPGSALLLLALALPGCGKPCQDPAPGLNRMPPGQLRAMLKGYPGDWRADTDQSKGVPEPAPEKEPAPGALRIDLPPVSELPALGRQSLGEALAARRSVRTFAPDPLRLAELAYLLWATQGVTHTGSSEDGSVHRFRAAPSGGGRYPLETYLAVRAVDGLKPGVYRYLPLRHQLVSLREAPGIGQELQQACYGQPFPAQAAVTFIWSAIPYRTEWKYAYLAPRLIAMEAGHVCQNLYLAAGSIQAGACALLSYHQPALDELIGVDGNDEFAVYLACAGKLPPP